MDVGPGKAAVTTAGRIRVLETISPPAHSAKQVKTIFEQYSLRKKGGHVVRDAL